MDLLAICQAQHNLLAYIDKNKIFRGTKLFCRAQIDSLAISRAQKNVLAEIEKNKMNCFSNIFRI